VTTVPSPAPKVQDRVASDSQQTPASAEPKELGTQSAAVQAPAATTPSATTVVRTAHEILSAESQIAAVSVVPITRSKKLQPASSNDLELQPPPPSSGLMVQISTTQSESEAYAAFRNLQAKFPNELGARHPVIQRADSGLYRVRVGPFASLQEAREFCVRHRTAGGMCVVVP
jgi:cell division septation protein DedD